MSGVRAKRAWQRARFALSMLVVCGISGGCVERVSSGAPSDDALRFEARVTRVELEGGFWGLIATDGTRYDPLKLPSQFRRDGMRVRVVAESVEAASIHMWGTLIRVIEIESEQ